MKIVRSVDAPLRVDFVPSEALAMPGRLGMTFGPGKKAQGLECTWDRSVALDLDALRAVGCTLLVSLMEDHELTRFGMRELLTLAAPRGIELVRFPICDGSVPLPEEAPRFDALVARIDAALAAGSTTIVHCRGGLGRTGLVAAALLTRRGYDAPEAIRVVRAARPGTVENDEQARYVEAYARGLRR
jgi:protein-tyrosine phosphatase